MEMYWMSHRLQEKHKITISVETEKKTCCCSHTISHTSEMLYIMPIWLTSQNRNLVSLNINFVYAVHQPLFTWLYIWMHEVNAWSNEGKEHERTTSPRIWLDFFYSRQSSYTQCVLWSRYIQSKAYTLSENIFRKWARYSLWVDVVMMSWHRMLCVFGVVFIVYTYTHTKVIVLI